MKFVVLVFACIVISVSFSHAATPAPPLALKGLDPIALSAGKEVAGVESLEVKHGQFRYRFANEDNKRVFEAKPEERGIQFGGACGKMGPFSGRGNPDRFFIHDQRIYVFASESCREAFKKDPEKHIDRANPAPEGNAAQLKRGAEVMERVLAGFGGAKKVDELKTFQEIVKHVYKQGDKETIGTHRVSWAFPDRVRVEQEFSTAYGYVVHGPSAFEFYGKDHWALESSIREIGWRQALRQPLAMLKHRDAKGFVAVFRGVEKIDGTPVELVAVALNGAASTWFVDAMTGRVLQIEYQARRGTVGENRITFSDFRPVDGLILPHQHKLFFNGKEVTSPEVRLERFVVNGDLKPDLFVQPK